jgi:hypothetical protein
VTGGLVEPRQQQASRGWVRPGDLRAFVTVVAVVVLLGAPAGLIFRAFAPRFTLYNTDAGTEAPNIESTKAFIGADGTYVVVIGVLGLICGLLAWRFARQYGPWTVLGLAVGGTLAALVAAEVGLMPGPEKVVEALAQDSTYRGPVDLFLGVRDTETGELSLRGAWGAIAWPLMALVAFVGGSYRSPGPVD